MNESPAATVSTSGVGWIAVRDQTPPPFDEVLACCKLGKRVVVVQALLSWSGARWGYDHGAAAYQGEVTHWMPLPAPPATA